MHNIYNACNAEHIYCLMYRYASTYNGFNIYIVQYMSQQINGQNRTYKKHGA
jgi:hypothetical protein